jgi:hypothetical protein
MVKLQFRELVVRRGSSGNLWIRQHRAAPAGAPDGSKAVVGGELCCLEEGNGLDLQGWWGLELRRPSALPHRDGEAPAAVVSA